MLRTRQLTNPSPGQDGHATLKRLPTLERVASVLPDLHQPVRAGGYPHDRDCSEAGKQSRCVHRGQPELPSALPIRRKRRSVPCRLCLLSRSLRSGEQHSACQLTGRLHPAFPEIRGTGSVSGWRVVRFYWNKPDARVLLRLSSLRERSRCRTILVAQLGQGFSDKTVGQHLSARISSAPMLTVHVN